MYCSKCGTLNDPSANFCLHCGKPFELTEKQQMVEGATRQIKTTERGRGVLILTLGILSLILFGPILGIPAWIMGHRDRKKIKAGVMALSHQGLTTAGMILGIIGTLFSGFIIILGIAIAVGLSLYSAGSISAERDAIINDINNISANAYQYYIRPASFGGGGGSYNGYTIPIKLQSKGNATYEIVSITETEIVLKGTSIQYPANTIQVTIGSDGRALPGSWIYCGDFE